MTRLFERFVQDMQLRNFSESTIRSYAYALKQLAAHFNKAPELINEQGIKDYFLYNRNVKHWSRAAFFVSISAIKFFFEKTLQKQWHVFGLVRPPRDKSLPVILSLKEVNKIFSCIKMEDCKGFLKTILITKLLIVLRYCLFLAQSRNISSYSPSK
ncbi:site-specific integrase [Calditrichota bacterium LG25]